MLQTEGWLVGVVVGGSMHMGLNKIVLTICEHCAHKHTCTHITHMHITCTRTIFSDMAKINGVGIGPIASRAASHCHNPIIGIINVSKRKERLWKMTIGCVSLIVEVEASDLLAVIIYLTHCRFCCCCCGSCCCCRLWCCCAWCELYDLQ